MPMAALHCDCLSVTSLGNVCPASTVIQFAQKQSLSAWPLQLDHDPMIIHWKLTTILSCVKLLMVLIKVTPTGNELSCHSHSAKYQWLHHSWPRCHNSWSDAVCFHHIAILGDAQKAQHIIVSMYRVQQSDYGMFVSSSGTVCEAD
jgi:hypothetical protein